MVKYGGWVAKLVARLFSTDGSSLSSNPDISQKYKMGDISKGWPIATLARQKIYKKFKHFSISAVNYKQSFPFQVIRKQYA